MTAYTDLMKVNRDWTYKQFEQEQNKLIRRKLHAYEEFGMGTPVWNAQQIIDGKRRLFFANRPNKFQANFFNTLAMALGLSAAGSSNNYIVDYSGTADDCYIPGNTTSGVATYWLNAENASGNSLANVTLGTDTSTASTRLMYNPVSPITCSAPSATYSQTAASQTWQGSKTAYQTSQSNVALAYAANATSGNPTIGEVVWYMVIMSSNTPTYKSASVTRLAAADGVFTAFTVTSSAALTLNWQINWPTT